MEIAQPATPRRNEITIRISKPLFATLQQMCQIAKTQHLESFVAELLETNIVEFRSRKFCAQQSLVLAPKESRPSVPYDGPRAVLSPEKIQQLFFLYDSEGINSVQLARRFNCSVTTIRRLLATREECKTHVAPATVGYNHRCRGAPITLQKG